MPEVDAAKIAALNDQARRTFEDCRVVVTRGIEAITDVQAILHQVRVFDQFTPSNDPYGEHDFGSFIYADITIFWKFERVSDLLCMSNLVHASATKEHDNDDDYQGTFRRAAERR